MTDSATLDERARLAALSALRLLDTPREERFDRITRTAARLFDVPVALLSLIDAERQWIKAAHGFDRHVLAPDESLCVHAIHADTPLVLLDLALHPRFAHHPLVAGPAGFRFYAGQPLHAGSGERVGVLGLLDRQPRAFGSADRQALADLAAWAERELAAPRDDEPATERPVTSGELDRLKTQFVSLVSHEMRTPLTSIKGFVDLLLDGEVGAVNDEQREFLTIVKENADRLIALVSNLLDLSRIESGSVQLDRTMVDCAGLIEEVVAPLRRPIEEHGQTLSLNIAPALPPLWCDRLRVTQILTILLENASRYTPRGGRLAIGVQADDDVVRVDVQDSGVGLLPDELPHVFRRFFRARNRATEEAGGTGLGLAIARSLVELHGGTIGVVSTPGQGSTFSLTLPVVQGEPEAN